MADGPVLDGKEVVAQAVEITPEMLSAGVSAIRPLELELWEASSVLRLEQLVAAVFVAMVAASNRASKLV